MQIIIENNGIQTSVDVVDILIDVIKISPIKQPVIKI